MLAGMPPQAGSNKRKGASTGASARSSAAVCTALTTGGVPCKRKAVKGLTVCKSHGGGTAASVGVSKKARVSQRAATLWGIDPDTSGVDVVDSLNGLARNKLTDITAIRIELGANPGKYYGMMDYSEETIDDEVTGVTYKSKKVSGTHPLVQELHKAEQELVQILRLIQEVSGGSTEVDTKRLRMQTARETARILKAYPGISVDDVAMEVAKNA